MSGVVSHVMSGLENVMMVSGVVSDLMNITCA